MTRSPRPGEINMVDNEFITEEEYKRIAAAGDLVTNFEAFGTHYVYRKSFIEDIRNQNVIPAAIVYTPIVEQFLRVYPESIGVFLMPVSEELLIQRMKERGESNETIRKRLATINQEKEAYYIYQKHYKYCFEIKDNEGVYDNVKTILKEYKINY